MYPMAQHQPPPLPLSQPQQLLQQQQQQQYYYQPQQQQQQQQQQLPEIDEGNRPWSRFPAPNASVVMNTDPTSGQKISHIEVSKRFPRGPPVTQTIRLHKIEIPYTNKEPLEFSITSEQIVSMLDTTLQKGSLYNLDSMRIIRKSGEQLHEYAIDVYRDETNYVSKKTSRTRENQTQHAIYIDEQGKAHKTDAIIEFDGLPTNGDKDSSISLLNVPTIGKNSNAKDEDDEDENSLSGFADLTEQDITRNIQETPPQKGMHPDQQQYVTVPIAINMPQADGSEKQMAQPLAFILQRQFEYYHDKSYSMGQMFRALLFYDTATYSSLFVDRNELENLKQSVNRVIRGSQRRLDTDNPNDAFVIVATPITSCKRGNGTSMSGNNDGKYSIVIQLELVFSVYDIQTVIIDKPWQEEMPRMHRELNERILEIRQSQQQFKYPAIRPYGQ